MKTDSKIKAVSVIISIVIVALFLAIPKITNINESSTNKTMLSDNLLVSTEKDITSIEKNTTEEKKEEKIEEQPVVQTEPVVYDGLTRQQLIDKINKNLNSTIAGKGETFVDLALQYGMDPYLSVAIVLHETGCSWDCSDLVKYCYNVGGQKGEPSCGGGSYMAYSSLDEGINGFMSNLYYNYYSQGLTTPELMNSKYAASTAWAGSINNYIEKIKAS